MVILLSREVPGRKLILLFFGDLKKACLYTFSCEAPIISDVAEVNPIVTGREIRSTNAPNLKSAIMNSTIPARKHKRTAKFGPEIPPRPV